MKPETKTLTIEFVKSIPFPGKRYQAGEQLTGTIVKAGVRPDGVEVCVFVTSDGKALVGLSYRSFKFVD